MKFLLLTTSRLDIQYVNRYSFANKNCFLEIIVRRKNNILYNNYSIV